MQGEDSEDTVGLEDDATVPSDPIAVAWEIPRTIGRYQVTGPLGEGGMATVVTAEDRELRRQVAIKLLTPTRDQGSTDDGTTRLLAEARAMARLSHPSIVRIFDVGRVGERVFIAMELVRGETLQAWLNHGPRPWGEIVAVFEQAGRGLQAAHDAGVVHRDFKPNNVMVSHGDRARVLDFGLAKPGGDPPPASDDNVTERSGDSDVDGGSTRTGVVMGTPRYMAPEQHFKRVVGPPADQYAFCIALYEALSGTRAFRSSSVLELACAKEGAAPPRPAQSDVPLSVWLAIERGLHPSPDARWPSMNALLQAIHAPPRRRRTPIVVAGTIVGVGFGALALPEGAPVPCTTEVSTAALGDAWSDPRREVVRRALVATDAEIGADQWARVHARLDRYANGWIQAHNAACLSLRDAAPDAALHDRRTACLQWRRTSLASAASALSRLDAANLSRATSIAADLPAVERCSDGEYLSQQILLPEDPVERAEAERIRERLAEAQSLEVAGDLATASRVVDEALAAARALDHRPALAESLLLAADIRSIDGSHDDAIRLSEEATWVAELTLHHDIAAKAAILRANEAQLAADYETGMTWVRRAREAAARLGDDDVRLATIEQTSGVLLLRTGRLAEAREAFEAALNLELRALPDAHHDLAVAHANLAMLHLVRADDSAAERHSRAAVAIFEAALGPDHPGMATMLEGLGAVQLHMSDFSGAAASLGRAVANRERVDRAAGARTDPSDAARGRFLLARALDEGGTDRARARQLADAARSALPPDHADRTAIDAWLAERPPG